MIRSEMPISDPIVVVEFMLLRFFRIRRTTNPCIALKAKSPLLIVYRDSSFPFIVGLFVSYSVYSLLLLSLFLIAMASVMSLGFASGAQNSIGSLVTCDADDDSASDRPVGYVEKCPKNRYIRYKEVLGRGAYKTVYKAFDQIEGIEVAWNRVKTENKLRSPEDLEKLFSEVHLLRNLQHENIIKFYDSWFDEKKKAFHMITELFSSGSLRQYRKKHRSVDIKAIKNWARQILQGLDYLHSQNPPIIHRDLKCDNIFVNGNHGEIKIGDLGLATVMQQPKAKSVIGTPEFMAPELYEEEYNELVDIYSFGMCMLEMVTLDYPYSECQNPAQIYRKVTNGVKPASLDKIASQEVKDFVEKCLLPASERSSAKELLNGPFLKYEHSKAPFPNSLQLPDEVSRFLSIATNGSHSVDIDQECVKSAYTASPIGSPRSTLLEFQRIHQNTVFRLKGEKINENSISFTFRIADHSGQVKNISFSFYPPSDTAVNVAAEMVQDLDLADHYLPFIAEFIDFLVSKLLPDWKPSSEYYCSTGGDLSDMSLIADECFASQRSDSQTQSMAGQCGTCVIPKGLQLCLADTNAHGNSYSMSPFETFAPSSCLTLTSNDKSSRDSITYMTIDSSVLKNNDMYSNGESISESDFSDMFYDESCKAGSGGSSHLDRSSNDSGLILHNPNRGLRIGSQTSCCLSSTLRENDCSLSELTKEIDAIERQYQQGIQDLARRKVEDMEAIKRKWMMMKKQMVPH